MNPEEMAPQIIVGTLSALAGAFLGARFALYQLRRQTAFDRQLLWCEEALKRLHLAGAAVVSAQSSLSDPEEAEACWTEAIKRYHSLIPLCGQKEIYASADAIEAIRSFMREFACLIDNHLKGHEHGAGTKAQCDDCLIRLQVAGLRLSQEARAHLGFPKLVGEAADARHKFVGSFRGRKLYQHR